MPCVPASRLHPMIQTLYEVTEKPRKMRHNSCFEGDYILVKRAKLCIKKCNKVTWVDMGCYRDTKKGMASPAGAMLRVGAEQCHSRNHGFPCPKCTYLFSKHSSSKQLNPNSPWRLLVISDLFHCISSCGNSPSPQRWNCHLLDNAAMPHEMLNGLLK